MRIDKYTYIMKNPFFYIEKYVHSDVSNLIDYQAGPIKFVLDSSAGIITIYTNDTWVDLMPLVLETTKEAWEFTDSDVTHISKTKVCIKCNFTILLNYLNVSILFV